MSSPSSGSRPARPHPQKFLETDTTDLIAAYARFLHLLVFAWMCDWDTVHTRYTLDQVVFPDLLTVRFISTEPPRVVLITEFPDTVPKDVSARVRFTFDHCSDGFLSVEHYVRLRCFVHNLNSVVLKTVLSHPMLTRPTYRLHINNFFCYNFLVKYNTSQDSYYRIIHTAANLLTYACYPLNSPFQETIFQSFPLQPTQLPPTQIAHVMNLIHAAAHLTLLSFIMLPPHKDVNAQNEVDVTPQYVAAVPKRLPDDDLPVLALRETTNTTENPRFFAQYFTERFGTPKTSYPIIAADIFYHYFIRSRNDISNDIAILPLTYFVCFRPFSRTSRRKDGRSD